MKKRTIRSIVPNLLTLVNLFCGFTALVHITNQDFKKAAIFILIAAIFDMLDGIAARLVKATSEFGAELDSLCDVVSFGVAPSFMLYQMYFHTFSEIGVLFASLPALAGASRLARFNVQLVGFEDKKYFTGLPIPAAALFIVSYLIYYHLGTDLTWQYKQIAAFVVTISASLAMVSTIKFDNLPRPSKKSIAQRPVEFSILIIGIFFSIYSKGKFVFPFMMFYVVASSLRHLVKWIKKTRQVDEDFDESEEFIPKPFD